MENNQLSRMEEMLGTLIKMVGENNSRLKTLEDKSEIVEKEIREVKISLKELVESRERQDRILEMLSVKAIETDSYILDFKRKIM